MSWDFSGNLKPSLQVSKPSPIRASMLALMAYIFIFSGCTPADSKKQHLFNQIYFQLHGKEQLLAPTQGHVHTFQHSISVLKQQVPLYKVVKGPDYYMYIGKPMESLWEVLHRDTILWNDFQSSKSTCYASIKGLPQKNALLYTDAPSKFLMILLQDSTALKDMTSYESLITRLEFNNN